MKSIIILFNLVWEIPKIAVCRVKRDFERLSV